MNLAAGQMLNHFRLVEKIDAGGMGVVWQAHDTKLDRRVAIKVVADDLAGDAEHLARFDREAKILAALNHPHIAAVHGLHEQDGRRFIEMELVDGVDLAHRIAGGRVPVEETLRIARGIAEALEAAHGRGIVHRDLKPANVRVTSRGTVKVLDFGLAKRIEPAAGRAGDTSDLPTLSAALTEHGVIVGTAAYMSPEQVKTGEADRRADVWAFGCVLYELLSGRRAFAGDTVTETLAAVLRGEPEWQRLPAATPPAVRRLLWRCLQKEDRRRLQDIGDARVVLEEALEGNGPPGEALRPLPPRRRWGLAAATLAAGALLGGVVTFLIVHHPPAKSGTLRMAADLPDGLIVPTLQARVLAIAPDGSQLAFVGHDGRKQQLYVRRLDETAVRVIPGTEGAHGPFFSPDGEWIGFRGQKGELLKARISGGAPVALGPTAHGAYFGADWGEDGTIVIGRARHPLARISANGGELQPITRLDGHAGELSHLDPVLLPNGRTVLFTADMGPDRKEIDAVALDGGGRHMVIEDARRPMYVHGGYLVFSRGEVLMGVRFDPARARVIGSPVPFPERVAAGYLGEVMHAAMSASGTLIYLGADDAQPKRALVKVDRRGHASPLPCDERAYQWLNLSRDGRWLAVSTWGEENLALWVSPLERFSLGRLEIQGRVGTPVWHPTEPRVAFSSDAEGHWDMYSIPVDGTAPATRMIATPYPDSPTSWIEGGRRLVFQDWSEWRVGILTWPTNGGPPDTMFVDSGYGGTVSPDGRWIAYGSAVSGSQQIYVRRFPTLDGRRQVSVRGGLFPAWSPSGDELFYVRGYPFTGRRRSDPAPFPGVEGAPEFIAVTVGREPDPAFGEERVLFSEELNYGAFGARAYDVGPDAAWFITSGPDHGTAANRIHVVAHWTADLGARLASGSRRRAE